MIVDCHTHWGICWQERYPDNPDPWLAVLDKHGISAAFLMPHAGIQDSRQCALDNDRLAELARKSPRRLVPLGSAWPQLGERAVQEARRCLTTLKMKGLKFHPWLQGFSLSSTTFGQICGFAGEAGAPIFFHDGTPPYSLSEQVAGLARRFPKTTFVLGHSGILWNWRSALAASRHANIWICLCGPHLRAMEILAQKADPDRILWGSDFGFGLADPIAYRLPLLRAARIADELRDKILSANPRRLMRLNEGTAGKNIADA